MSESWITTVTQELHKRHQNNKSVYTEDSDLVSKIKDSDELTLFPPVSGGSFSLRI
jgi:molybdopterin converting factor small subunit